MIMWPRNAAFAGQRPEFHPERPKLGELKAPDWPGRDGPLRLAGMCRERRRKACEDPTGADKGREKLRRSFVEGLRLSACPALARAMRSATTANQE